MPVIRFQTRGPARPLTPGQLPSEEIQDPNGLRGVAQGLGQLAGEQLRRAGEIRSSVSRAQSQVARTKAVVALNQQLGEIADLDHESAASVSDVYGDAEGFLRQRFSQIMANTQGLTEADAIALQGDLDSLLVSGAPRILQAVNDRSERFALDAERILVDETSQDIGSILNLPAYEEFVNGTSLPDREKEVAISSARRGIFERNFRELPNETASLVLDSEVTKGLGDDEFQARLISRAKSVRSAEFQNMVQVLARQSFTPNPSGDLSALERRHDVLRFLDERMGYLPKDQRELREAQVLDASEKAVAAEADYYRGEALFAGDIPGNSFRGFSDAQERRAIESYAPTWVADNLTGRSPGEASDAIVQMWRNLGGAPHFLGDMLFQSMRSPESAQWAANTFRDVQRKDPLAASTIAQILGDSEHAKFVALSRNLNELPGDPGLIINETVKSFTNSSTKDLLKVYDGLVGERDSKVLAQNIDFLGEDFHPSILGINPDLDTLDLLTERHKIAFNRLVRLHYGENGGNLQAARVSARDSFLSEYGPEELGGNEFFVRDPLSRRGPWAVDQMKREVGAKLSGLKFDGHTFEEYLDDGEVQYDSIRVGDQVWYEVYRIGEGGSKVGFTDEDGNEMIFKPSTREEFSEVMNVQNMLLDDMRATRLPPHRENHEKFLELYNEYINDPDPDVDSYLRRRAALSPKATFRSAVDAEAGRIRQRQRSIQQGRP